MILFYDYVELNGCLEPFFLLLNGFDLSVVDLLLAS